jgi:hypothetical protein
MEKCTAACGIWKPIPSNTPKDDRPYRQEAQRALGIDKARERVLDGYGQIGRRLDWKLKK